MWVPEVRTAMCTCECAMQVCVHYLAEPCAFFQAGELGQGGR